MPLLFRPLDNGYRASDLSRKIIRHILADRLYSDLACDKLDGGIAKFSGEAAVGRMICAFATEDIDQERFPMYQRSLEKGARG